MNDNDLSTAVRESVAGVRSSTPVDQIISWGRAVRARRRILGVAGAVAVAAGATLAVTTLLPSGHPGPPPGASADSSANVELAAWKVDKLPNGDIDITINELKDPAGLQATLRANGLPVNVNFSGGQNWSCRMDDSAGKSTLDAVAEWRGNHFTIHPAVVPHGDGVAIIDRPAAGSAKAGSAKAGSFDGVLAVGLVHASPQCTG